MSHKQPLVAIIMGSDSDWPVMQVAANILDEFDVAYEARVPFLKIGELFRKGN
jgi:5-(carboxyamino)imidazole ribonucleotide mutase